MEKGSLLPDRLPDPETGFPQFVSAGKLPERQSVASHYRKVNLFADGPFFDESMCIYLRRQRPIKRHARGIGERRETADGFHDPLRHRGSRPPVVQFSAIANDPA